MTVAHVPTRRHLVYDDTETFRSRLCSANPFRIRVWLAKEATPVVFVTPVDGGVHKPHRYRCLIANWVNVAILRHSDYGMLYFDAAYVDGVPVVNLEMFSYIGHQFRMRLCDPVVQPSSLERISSIVGEPVEL